MSKRIMVIYYIFYLFLICLLSCTGEKNSTTSTAYEITKSEAIQIVLSDIISSDTLEKGLYIFPEIINAGDSVYCTLSDTSYCVDYNSWFLFIDDFLTADWAHPCRFVFVDNSRRRYDIYPEMWPPQYYWDFRLEVVKEWHP